MGFVIKEWFVTQHNLQQSTKPHKHPTEVEYDTCIDYNIIEGTTLNFTTHEAYQVQIKNLQCIFWKPVRCKECNEIIGLELDTIKQNYKVIKLCSR